MTRPCPRRRAILSASMVVEKEKVDAILHEALRQTNELLPKEKRLKAADDTVLFGDGAALDSLGLVNLLVAVEQGIADTFNCEVTLATDKAVARKNSPFRTVATLRDYVMELLGEVG